MDRLALVVVTAVVSVLLVVVGVVRSKFILNGEKRSGTNTRMLCAIFVAVIPAVVVLLVVIVSFRFT